MHDTLDMDPLIRIINLLKKSTDYDADINNIITGFTIWLRKIERNEKDIK